MRERINKPRVFLSHARKDVAFIERIENDLRKCQIEPWRDQNEIRDGQPFMESIFEGGIPTCDAVLTYFTENSINSEMVKKEIDSALIRRLEDSNVVFLPYVNEDETRKKLRVDIQTLQCRVWNEKNYSEILPLVVAEIWRSYIERSVENALTQEKNRRLELEIENKRLSEIRDTEIFSNKEEKEFQFIFSRLDFVFNVSISTYIENAEFGEKDAGQYIVRISFLQFLLDYIKRGFFYYGYEQFCEAVEQIIIDNKFLDKFLGERKIDSVDFSLNFFIDLAKYGLLNMKTLGELNEWMEFGCPFSERMSRFWIWIEYKDVKSVFPMFEYIDFVEKSS